jgi:hypothetical protein
MRDGEIGLVDDHIAGEQDVHIEGSGPPPFPADATRGGLQPVAKAQELAGCEAGVQFHDGVEMIVLTRWAADGLGLVQGRDRNHTRKAFDRATEVGSTIAEVRSQPNEHSHSALKVG